MHESQHSACADNKLDLHSASEDDDIALASDDDSDEHSVASEEPTVVSKTLLTYVARPPTAIVDDSETESESDVGKRKSVSPHPASKRVKIDVTGDDSETEPESDEAPRDDSETESEDEADLVAKPVYIPTCHPPTPNFLDRNIYLVQGSRSLRSRSR